MIAPPIVRSTTFSKSALEQAEDTAQDAKVDLNTAGRVQCRSLPIVISTSYGGRET